MKKVFLLYLLIFSFKSHIYSQFQICDTIFPQPQPIIPGSSTVPYPNFSTYIERNAANYMITRYDQNRVFSDIKYFLFDAGTLLKYLYIYGNKLQYVQFFLSRDLTTSHNATINVIGVDKQFNHIYLDEGVLTGSLACNLFSITNTCNARSYNFEMNNTIYEGPIQGFRFCDGDKLFPYSRDISAYSGKPYSIYVTKNTSTQMIHQYSDNAPTGSVTSFIFDAGTLAKFIYNLNGVQDIEIKLCRDPDASDGLRVVISGIDSQGRHVYYSGGQVLEHCYPCPNECPVQSSINHKRIRGNIGANKI